MMIILTCLIVFSLCCQVLAMLYVMRDFIYGLTEKEGLAYGEPAMV